MEKLDLLQYSNLNKNEFVKEFNNYDSDVLVTAYLDLIKNNLYDNENFIKRSLRSVIKYNFDLNHKGLEFWKKLLNHEEVMNNSKLEKLLSHTFFEEIGFNTIKQAKKAMKKIGKKTIKRTLPHHIEEMKKFDKIFIEYIEKLNDNNNKKDIEYGFSDENSLISKETINCPECNNKLESVPFKQIEERFNKFDKEINEEIKICSNTNKHPIKYIYFTRNQFLRFYQNWTDLF